MYKDSNVTIKIVAKCKEEDRFQVQRDLLREYRMLLTENGIDIAFPQVVMHQAEAQEYIVTKSEKNSARAFFEQQRELSEGLEEQQGT